MPPAKKTLDKGQKPSIKRIRKSKPPLKIPTVISIKIPARTEPVPEPPPVVAPKVTKRQGYAQIKLDLANEVARAQLDKSKPIIFDEPKEKVVVAKRGRRRKVIPDLIVDDKVATVPQTKTPRRVLNRKVIPDKITTKEKAAPKKRQADSTVKKNIKRPKLTPQPDALGNIETEPIKITRRITRRTCKGKQEELTTAGISPSILPGYDITSKSRTNTVTPKKVIDSKPSAKDVFTSPDKASFIASRKSSLNSTASSGPSWTRDISSTSTTTCVTVSSNEFVRINRKLPVIELTNIDSEVSKYKNNDIDESSSSDSDSDSSASEPKYSEHLNSCIGLNPPKLSASSSNSPVPNTDVDKSDKMVFLLDKLKSVLKKFDMEIINGIRFDNDEITADVKRLKDKLVDIVNNEFGIINHCKHVRRILDPQSKDHEDIMVEIPAVEPYHGVELSAPFTHTEDSNEFKDDQSFHVDIKNIDMDNDSSSSEPAKEDLEHFTSDKLNYNRFDQGDDDDALSLYAESLTGIDSSRLNSSIASMSDVRSEEYIPQPIKSAYLSPETYVYRPTKIADANQSVKPKPICEKQNADSTSIYRENIKHELEKIISDKPAIDDTPAKAGVNLHKEPPPCLMSSQFKPINVVQSLVFKGVCFFNLINSCKKYSIGQPCRFPHVTIDVSEVKERLAKVNEEWFIQEYVTMRSWPELRRLYGLCFVNECVRRELTRILVEMALDFVKKANAKSVEDLALKVHVAETTLLHLNNVGLRECEDLLKYFVCQGTQLCDFFIETIAHTQNFSRFKRVFINLTSYMVKNGRTFSFSVASSILERVCILPYDEGLTRAILEIIKHTDRHIFENSMIKHFERQISSKELYEEYLSVKRSWQRPASASPDRGHWEPAPPRSGEPAPPRSGEPAPHRSGEPAPPRSGEPGPARREEDGTVPASPDTTEYDNMNKNTDEPIIKRIVDFNRAHAQNANVPPTFVSPNTSQTQRVIRKGIPALSNWKPNVYPNMRPQFGPRPHFGPQRPPRPMGTPLKRPHRLVTYAETSTRYTPRRPGPNY